MNNKILTYTNYLSLFLVIVSFGFLNAQQNLLNANNPSFEDGNTGFQTNGGYALYAGSSSDGSDYAIISNPNTMNPEYSSSITPFDGTKMMVVDADPNNEIFWKQSPNVQLEGGVTYTFSYYVVNVQTVAGKPAPTIVFSAEDQCSCTPTLISGSAQVNNTTWQKVTYEFTPAGTGQKWVRIELKTQGADQNGNDFAIDAMTLTPPPLPLSISASHTKVSCPGAGDASISAYGFGGTIPYSYTISGANLPAGYTITNSTGIFQNLEAGTYSVSVTDGNETKSTSITIDPVTDMTIEASTTANANLLTPTSSQNPIPEVTICNGESITIKATNLTNHRWTANPTDTTLTSPNNSTITVTPTQDTEYTVTADGPTGALSNLVYNGDFESDTAGFSSDYRYFSNNSSYQQNAYGVDTNPNTWGSVYDVATDHTTGSGNMFITDGATVANTKVWVQNIAVVPGITYEFKYFIRSITTGKGNPARMQIKINGVVVNNSNGSAEDQAFPNTADGWKEFTRSWTAPVGVTIATIQMIDVETASAGNDFALDDITFIPTSANVCTPQKKIKVKVSTGTLDGKFSYPTPVCKNTDSNPTPSPDNQSTFTTGGTYSVSSSNSADITIDSTSGEIDLSTTKAGTYTIKYTKAVSGCSPAIDESFTIEINETQALPSMPPFNVCSGTDIDIPNLLTLAGVTIPAGMTFAWENKGDDIGMVDGLGASAMSGTGIPPKFTATNTGATTLTATIEITPTLNSCVGSTTTYTVNVNPSTTPDTSFTYSQRYYCESDANPIPMLAVGAKTGGTYSCEDGSLVFVSTNTGEINIASTPHGTYEIKYKVAQDAASCQSEAESTYVISIIKIADPITATTHPTCTTKGSITVQKVSGNGSSLFISEVTDADTGSLTYVELYNGTSFPIDMTQYKLKVHQDGHATPDCTKSLTGTLAVGDAYVIAIGADTEINNEGIAYDIKMGATCGINTNDYLVLSNIDDNVVDVWGDSSGADFTPNAGGYVYRRKLTATVPSTAWNENDWYIIDNQDFSDVGNYMFNSIEYSYCIDGACQVSNEFTNLDSGNYDITIKEVNSSCESKVKSVTIKPVPNKPVIGAVSNITLCEGEIQPKIDFTTDQDDSAKPNLITYSWTNDNTAIGLVANGSTNNIPQFTAANTTGSIVANISVTATNTDTGCVSDPMTFTITVNPKLQPTLSCGTATQTSVTFTWAAVAGATGYDITYFDKDGTVGTANGTLDMTTDPANPTYLVSGLSPNETINIKVTPTGAVGTCFKESMPLGCTAQDCPSITAINPATITRCQGDTTTTNAITLTTEFTGTDAIKFVYFDTQQTGGAMYTGGIELAKATPDASKTVSYTLPVLGAGSIPDTAGTYYIYAIADSTPASPSCRPFQEIAVTVNAKPTVDNITDIEKCNGETISEIQFSDGLTGSTFNWKNNNTDIGLVANGTGNIAQFTATNTTTGNIEAIIEVTSTNNGCVSDAKTFKITVKPTVDPDIEFTYDTTCISATTNPTPKPVDSSTFVIGGTYSVTSSNASDITIDANSGEINLSSTLAGTYEITYELPADASICRALKTHKANIVITNSITPNVIFTLPANVCLSDTTNPIPTEDTNFTAGGTYSVSSSNSADITIDANSGEIDLSSTKAGTYEVIYTVSASGCNPQEISSPIQIIIEEDQEVQNTNGDKEPIICINTAITDIEFTISKGATSLALKSGSTLPNGVTFNQVGTSNVYTISGTPTEVGTFNYTVETSGTCTSKDISGTITVQEDDALALTSVAGTEAQTVCIDTDITAIVYTYSAGATDVTVTGLESSDFSVTKDATAKTVTITGQTSTAGTYNYTVTTTGNCKSATLSGTIGVNDLSSQVFAFSYDSADYCESGTTNPTPTGATGFVSGGTYTVTSSSTGTLSDLSINSTSGEINLASSKPGDYEITYTVTQDLANCKAGGSSKENVTIKPDSTLKLTSVAITQNQNICNGAPMTNITFEFGGGATNANATNLPPGINQNVDATTKTITISGTPTMVGVYNYEVVTTGSGCDEPKITGTIEVLELPNISNKTKTICSGTAFTVDSTDFVSPDILPTGTTFTWTAPVISAGGTITDGSAESTPQNSISQTLTNTGNADATATYTVTATSGTSPNHCTDTFDVVVTVRANPTATLTVQKGATGTPSQSISICAGGDSGLKFTGTPNAVVTYEVNIPTATTPTITKTVTLDASGEASPTDTTNTSVAEDTTFTIKSVALTDSDGLTCTNTISSPTASQIANVTAVQQPGVSISYSGGVICRSGTAKIEFTGTKNATVTYRVSTETADRTILLNSSGYASRNFTVSQTTTFTLVSIVEPISNCSQTLSNDVTVTVNTTPIPTVTSPQIFCSDSPSTVADLQATGTDLLWYNALGNLIPVTTALVDGQKYYVTQTLNGCESNKAEILVDLISLPADPLQPIVKCSSEVGPSGIPIDTGLSSSNYSFVWSTGDTGSFIQVYESGTYSVTISDNNLPSCTVTYSTEVTVLEAPTITDIIPGNGTLEIVAEGDNEPFLYSLDGNNWQYSNEFTGLKEGDYTVYVKENVQGCETITSATVFVIRNFISPGTSDSKNDVWKIDGMEMYPGAYIRIYDRYGKVLAESDDLSTFTWDGTYLNRPLPSTTYWYDIIFPSGKKTSGFIVVKNR
ncbi:MAG: T9SS type B sorting domain-containing protein [Flavobacteriales bacterium]|nr:T9SS type B sorting domain-containing protein [Flavobacteriales bacterium]